MIARRERGPHGLQRLVVALCVALVGANVGPLWAQASHPGSAAAPAGLAVGTNKAADAARDGAPFDLTGYWVSLVTADWRFRMVVPGRGEYAGIPINAAGKAFADKWSRATDEAAGKQCEAYGAAVLMAVPERLHIAWQDANTLEIHTDAGQQSRLLHFAATRSASPPPSLQGYSIAQWVLAPVTAPVEAQPFAITTQSAPKRSGQLELDTSQLLPGLLRKNGIPYSSRATLVEYWEVHTDPASKMRVLAITSRVTDSEYLAEPYVFNSLFSSQNDAAGWDPEPCSLEW